MPLSQLLGFVGTAIVAAAYIPQIHHLIKEHCSAGISMNAYALWGMASILFLIHAAMIRDVVFVIVQIVNLTATDPKNRTLSPILATLPKTAPVRCTSFACHTYKTPGGVDILPILARPEELFRGGLATRDSSPLLQSSVYSSKFRML